MGSRPLRLRSGALVALAVVLAGCGAAAHKTGTRRPEKKVTPQNVEQTFRRVERTFPALHLRMVNSGIYTSRDIPIIREYAFNVGSGDTNVGTLLVYATAKEAAADQSFGQSQGEVRRANLVAQFDPGTPPALRSILTAALHVAATGSGRVDGHSLKA